MLDKYTLLHIGISSIIIILAILLIYTLVTYRKKKNVANELESAILAISDIYSSLTLFDLKKHSVVPLRDTEIDDKVFKGDTELRDDKERTLAEHMASESSRESLYQFMKMNGIKDRIGALSHISHEYIDNNGKWNRLHLIVVERDAEGDIQKLLWAVESIDEDKKRQELFKSLAQTDSLTGLLNRNGGESRINDYLEQGKSGMLLVMDADHFKHVNDTYGHETGDKVIIALAECLKESFRGDDVAFRLGGDEFVAFAYGVDNQKCGMKVVNRLFDVVDKVNIEGVTD